MSVLCKKYFCLRNIQFAFVTTISNTGHSKTVALFLSIIGTQVSFKSKYPALEFQKLLTDESVLKGQLSPEFQILNISHKFHPALKFA